MNKNKLLDNIMEADKQKNPYITFIVIFFAFNPLEQYEFRVK
jgi:hypothetical protein